MPLPEDEQGFEDRRDAGRRLAAKLITYTGEPHLLVLALPCGGVPVAYEIAEALAAPLDVFLVRRLGVPGHDEPAMGAIASGGIRVLNDDVIPALRLDEDAVGAVAAREWRALRERELSYRGGGKRGRHHDRVQPARGTVSSPLPSRSRLLVHCTKMGATPNVTTRTLFCARAIADEDSGEPRARQRIRFARGAHRARHYDDPHGKDYLLASWTKGLSTLVRLLKYGRHMERLIRCARRYRCESGDDRDEVPMHAKKAHVVGFNHIALEVGDIEEALSFYARLFEFKLRGRSADMAFIDLGDQFLALQKGRSQPADDGRHFGLVVDDPQAVRQALADVGVEVLPGPFLDFRDPWGNRVEIVGYDNIQFSKAPSVLRGMGLAHLAKNPKAIKELAEKGMAPD
jgi:lactoylglutathione lyase